MSDNRKNKKYGEKKVSSEENFWVNSDKGGIEINLTIPFNIGNKEFHSEQRAEAGGQINKLLIHVQIKVDKIQ